MNKLIYLSIFYLVGIITGCQKYRCYECRAIAGMEWYAKGRDTIAFDGGNNGNIILQSWIDSGYVLVKAQSVHLAFDVTRCGLTANDFVAWDSCHLIK